MEKYKLIPRKLELSRGEKQEYYLDENPKANFAEYRKKDKKICVNKRFEELPRKEKIAVLYHERGHSNFYLWEFFHNLARFFYLFTVLSLSCFIIFMIAENLFWIIFIIIGIFFFVSFVSINYLLESIADVYSVAKTNNNTLIKIIKIEYSRKKNKKSWWAKYILHPSPDLREKIMGLILKWKK